MRRSGAGLLAITLAACSGAQGGPRDPENTRLLVTSPRQGEDEDPEHVLDGEVDDEVRAMLAETLIKSGAHANAVPLLREALARKPKDARLHYLLGVVLRDRGVYDQAERELTLATELQPTLAAAWSGLGILDDLRGEHERARTRHQKAVALAPGVARYHNNLGFSRYLAGDFEGAVAAYEEALRRDPSARPVYANLGFALAALGRDEDALRMFRQAGTEAAALNNLALAHELRGDPGRARQLYREALLLDPDLPEAVENLRALEREQARNAPGEGGGP